MLRNIDLIVATKACVGIYFIVTLLKITIISSVDTEQEWMFWRGSYIMNINKAWAEILADRRPAPLHPLCCNMFLSLALSAIKVSSPKPCVSISCSIGCVRHRRAELLKIIALHCRWVLLCGSQPASHSSYGSLETPGEICMDPALC